MKYLLLLNEQQRETERSPFLCLTEEEKNSLPFSLMPSLAENATPEGEISSESEEMTDTPASVLLFSDNAELLEKAREKKIKTILLPKRSFPFADLALCLSLDSYETVAIVTEEPLNDTELAALPKARTLTASLQSEGVTYTLDTAPSNAPTTLAELLSLFAEENKPSDTLTKASEKKASSIASIFEWIELFALSLAAVILVMTFFIRHSPVVGSSMSPTLHEGDVLLLSQIGFTLDTGDIVIIQTDKDDLRRPLVKRVIATGGEKIRIDFINWQIYINGILLKESYLDSTNKSEIMKRYSIARYLEQVDGETEVYEGTVPEGYLFVLGDNRQNSKDSRDLGFIDERHVIGEVVYRLLPLSVAGDPT